MLWVANARTHRSRRGCQSRRRCTLAGHPPAQRSCLFRLRGRAPPRRRRRAAAVRAAPERRVAEDMPEGIIGSPADATRPDFFGPRARASTQEVVVPLAGSSHVDASDTRYGPQWTV